MEDRRDWLMDLKTKLTPLKVRKCRRCNNEFLGYGKRWVCRMCASEVDGLELLNGSELN